MKERPRFGELTSLVNPAAPVSSASQDTGVNVKGLVMGDLFDAIDNALEAIVEIWREEETQNDYTLAGPAK